MSDDILDQIIKQNLTYLQRSELAKLHETIRQAENKGLKGDIVETGCALGGQRWCSRRPTDVSAE